jgi:hypothetical protein
MGLALSILGNAWLVTSGLSAYVGRTARFLSAFSMSIRATFFAAGLLICLGNDLYPAPIGTAFTYSGKLLSRAEPANGIYDFRVAGYDAVTGGAQTGPVLERLSVPVSNGVFALTLDFGDGVFTGEARWLDIGVRTNNSGPFLPLAPRQPVTPLPYSLAAQRLIGPLPSTQLNGALPGDSLSGVYGAMLAFNNPSNQFRGSGAGLTSLNAGQLALGTVPDERLSANVLLKSVLGILTPYDKGAVGDGLADDTAALQSWINDCQVSNLFAYLPPAKCSYYRITDTLVVSNYGGLKIEGSGGQAHSTQIKLTRCRIHQATPGKNGLIVIGPIPGQPQAGTVTDSIVFRDFLVTAETYDPTTEGVSFNGHTSDTDADNISGIGVINFGVGLNLQSACNVCVSGCSFGQNGDGIRVGGRASAYVVNSVVFSGCISSQNWSNALAVTGAQVLWVGGDLGSRASVGARCATFGRSANVVLLMPNVEHFGDAPAIVAESSPTVQMFNGRVVKMGERTENTAALVTTNASVTILGTVFNCRDTLGRQMIQNGIDFGIRSLEPQDVYVSLPPFSYTNWISDLRATDVPLWSGDIKTQRGQMKLAGRIAGANQDALYLNAHMDGVWGTTTPQRVDLLQYEKDKTNSMGVKNVVVGGFLAQRTNGLAPDGVLVAGRFHRTNANQAVTLSAISGLSGNDYVSSILVISNAAPKPVLVSWPASWDNNLFSSSTYCTNGRALAMTVGVLPGVWTNATIMPLGKTP